MTAPAEIDIETLGSPWKQAIERSYKKGLEEGIGTGFLVGLLFTAFVFGLGIGIYAWFF